MGGMYGSTEQLLSDRGREGGGTCSCGGGGGGGDGGVCDENRPKGGKSLMSYSRVLVQIPTLEMGRLEGIPIPSLLLLK